MPHVTKKAVADLIRRFIDGSCGPREWDDFISVRTTDSEIESVRKECASLPERFPPAPNSGAYCDSDGMSRLQEIATRLTA